MMKIHPNQIIIIKKIKKKKEIAPIVKTPKQEEDKGYKNNGQE